MTYDTGNRILDRLERSFGGLALPKALRWVAGFQLLTWLLALLSKDFLDWIVFDRQAVFSGQVWRLFTWALHPASQNPLFVLFAFFFLFFINDGLEAEWGSFRLNLYVLASIASISLPGLLPITEGAGAVFNSLFYSSVFLAFATSFPEQVIHLFGIIPIKAKWLGWVNAAMLGMVVASSSAPLILGVIVLVGLLPYLLVFAPGFFAARRLESETKVRRQRFEQETVADGTFHECATCGATERSHPQREFRVAADGNEYCETCRKTA